jgi:hypothetical protein
MTKYFTSLNLIVCVFVVVFFVNNIKPDVHIRCFSRERRRKCGQCSVYHCVKLTWRYDCDVYTCMYYFFSFFLSRKERSNANGLMCVTDDHSIYFMRKDNWLFSSMTPVLFFMLQRFPCFQFVGFRLRINFSWFVWASYLSVGRSFQDTYKPFAHSCTSDWLAKSGVWDAKPLWKMLSFFFP